MGARLTWGRSYARKGQVVSIDVSKGAVDAKVQGTGSEPYAVTIGLKPISEDGWAWVLDAMASKAIFAAKLLSGEMPTAIEDAFAEAGVSLDSFSVKPVPPAVVAAILKRLGDAPYVVGEDNISALLAKAYEVAGRRALQMVSSESDPDLEVDVHG